MCAYLHMAPQVWLGEGVPSSRQPTTLVVIHARLSRAGSGKTHTMLGGAGDGRGVIPRALEKLYARANELQQHHGWSITLQVMGLPLCAC